jgi:hypothetical protein
MKNKNISEKDTLRQEYNFDYSKAVRGKYYDRLMKEGPKPQKPTAPTSRPALKDGAEDRRKPPEGGWETGGLGGWVLTGRTLRPFGVFGKGVCGAMVDE